MRSFFLFSILGQSFGIDIERVKRILPAQYLTVIPDVDEHVEGMFQYEDEVVKVLSFRKALGHEHYASELQTLFKELKKQHEEWLEALIATVEKDVEFTKTTDSHACFLGEWIDTFQADSTEMKALVKNLNFHHQRLHASALEVFEIQKDDAAKARVWIEDNIQDMYKNTISYLDDIAQKSEEVAVSFQRCLILTNVNNELFGVNVDAVEDIIHVDDEQLHKPTEEQAMGEFMNLEAILEHDNKLVTIVKDINFDKIVK